MTTAPKQLAGFCGIFAFLMVSCTAVKDDTSSIGKEVVDYVNPYMGNISHLLVPTYPTVQLPNSLLRIYPTRRDYTGTTLHGLPLIVTSHRSGNTLTLSPYQGEEAALKPVLEYSYDQEKLTPYSYAVYLDEEEVEVNFGLSHQSAAYELQFEKDAPAALILNSRKGALKWDGTAISGYEDIGNGTNVYIYMIPETSPDQIASLSAGQLIESDQATGRNANLILKFARGENVIQIKYGISFIDEAQAKANMEREVLGKTIEQLHSAGRDIWNTALGKIQTEGGTEDDKVVFYSSLYRCYERPVCISEDGRYFSAYDGQVHDDGGRPFYTDDWIWDSYRAHHPLRILLDPVQEGDILHSFVQMTGQMENPWWPTFPGITGDHRAMNSNHGVATVVDAYRKGLTNFDLEQAYEATKAAIMEKTLAPWSGMPAGELDAFYHEHGYIPALYENEQETIPEVHHFERRQPIAVTLGTSYDQWCLSLLAEELGRTEDAEYFRKASFNYRKVFNHDTKFFHPRDSEGNFIEPFDYRFSGGMGARQYYDENNGWVYRWDVQHNIPDLIDLMGGNEAFVEELDAMFREPLGRSKYAFYAQLPDHTGNVGQFSMANEPSLHVPYLYAFAGQPWKSQKHLRKLVHEWFRNDLMGVPGDEDGGGMSAFVVFSQMGFYPVTPGDPVYTIGSPVFEHVRLELGNGNILEIEARNASPENKYIQSATLNGDVLNTPWINHEVIANGAKLEFVMGPRANKMWGTGK